MGILVQKRGEIISLEIRSLISKRYCAVTAAMNREFWGISSDRQNSIYVGSYGRGTAIDSSDIDILMTLPESSYNQFNSVYGNGQSRLLQAVRQFLVHIREVMYEQMGRLLKSIFQMGCILRFFLHLKTGMALIGIRILIWEVIGKRPIPRLNRMQ